MIKKILSLSILVPWLGTAYSQTSVTIYGSFDGGLRYVDNANAAGNSRVVMGSNGISSTNRIGFKGVEDLGGGFNAHFTLETGWNTGTGALESNSGSAFTGTGALWNRTAAVGIGVPFGSLDLGQQYSIAFKTIGLYDPFKYKFPSIIPLSTTAAGTGVSQIMGGTRFHNDIQYTGTFGPITARAEFSLGEIAGSPSKNGAKAIALSYSKGPIAVGGAYTRKKVASTGGLGSGNIATLTVPGTPAAVTSSPTYDDNAWTLGGSYKVGQLTVAAGYNSERLEGALNNTAVAGAILTPARGDAKTTVGWAGLSYDINPAVNVAAAWYQSRIDVPAAATGAAALGSNGRRDLFIFAATYAFSKRTNAYAELDMTKLNGNQVLGFRSAVTKDRIVGASLGILHSF